MTDNENKEDLVTEHEEEVINEELRETWAEIEEEREPTDDELLNKNTESFRCLTQTLISRSSLLRHPLYPFPPLEDPGIDEAFNYAEPPQTIDDTGAENYKRLCKELGIVPISRIIKSLPTSTLNLRFYGLSYKQVRALTEALRQNQYVRDLVLEGNFLTSDCAHQLGQMLQENYVLQVLNMKECRIGPTGASKLSEAILMSQTLRELNLSHNSLGAVGIEALSESLQENAAIFKLNLSHNELDEAAAPYLASILKENYAILELDLSWNVLCTPAAMKTICNDGLILNKYLKSLNLAWNGISNTFSVKPLSGYLKTSDNLQFLDLSHNGITGASFKVICEAVRTNRSLLGLSLGFNPLTPEEAQSLVSLLTLPVNQGPILETLDMDNVYVKKEFVPLWKSASRLGKYVRIGGVVGNYKITGPNMPKMLFDRARMLAMKPTQKKQRRDFSHFIFALSENPMRKDEFQELLKSFKMKLVDKDLVEEITKNFQCRKNDVDVAKMKQSYLKIYPDAEPPQPKKEKKSTRNKLKKRNQPEIAKMSELMVNDATSMQTKLPDHDDTEEIKSAAGKSESQLTNKMSV